MGRSIEFNFGANVVDLDKQGVPDTGAPPPDYAPQPNSNDDGCVVGELRCPSCGKYHGFCYRAAYVRREVQALKDLVRTGGLFDEVEIDYPPRPWEAKAAPESFNRGRWTIEWETNQETIMDLKSHRSKNVGGGKTKRNPFLKTKDIPKAGMPFKVLDFRKAPESAEYSDFFMDIATGKKEFVVGLKSESVLLDQLIDEFGTKTEKWVGKKGKFVRGGKKGQYINVG